ncbi:MAG TPA: hypothetical protein V6C84_16070 [Coleofasciculaceae cyanobacterium]|jgi:hypothetical protein
MHLNEYPTQIAQHRTQLLEFAQKICKARSIIQLCDHHIDYAIATDPSLKNDIQRKAVRFEMQSEEAYQTAASALQFLQDQQAQLEIFLEQIQSEFTVLKLEKRAAIAQLEAQAAQR